MYRFHVYIEPFNIVPSSNKEHFLLYCIDNIHDGSESLLYTFHVTLGLATV